MGVQKLKMNCPICHFLALTGAAQLRADGISSFCYIVYVHTTHYITIRNELRHEKNTWPGPLVDPCLLSTGG
jgi:hypothetical protein